jgi:glucokinase
MIGIDLGATRIKAVAIDSEGNILHQQYEPTNDGDDATWKTAIKRAVEGLRAKVGSEVVGISAPGLPAEDNRAIAFMPGRLQGLEGFVWSDYLGLPAYALNDAVSAMYAEARFGVARGRKNVIMLTLGTGVGGAILIDGKPYQGAFSKAGHLGHLTLDSEGEQDITGIPGSLEDAIGNCTIAKRTFGRFHSTEELLKAHSQGDAFATEVWLASVRKLAIGIASLTNILSPEAVILGGGITAAGDALFKPLETYLDIYEWRAGGNRTAILQAGYGDLAGAAGAACFASDKINNK